MELIEEEINIPGADGSDLTVFMARPQDEEKHPAIIVIHEIWGLNEQIRGVAQRYAQEGYVVIAPNLFCRYGGCLTEDRIRKAMGPMFAIPREQRNDPSAMQELIASMEDDDREVAQILFVQRQDLQRTEGEDARLVYDYLRNLDCVNADFIGITGFCMGGGLAFQLSTEIPFQVSVIFYGANPSPIENIAQLNGPVLIFYAGEDGMVNAGIAPLVAAALENKKTIALKIYAGMQHGFFNEYGQMYDAVQAKDAWQMAVAYFKQYLQPEGN